MEDNGEPLPGGAKRIATVELEGPSGLIVVNATDVDMYLERGFKHREAAKTAAKPAAPAAKPAAPAAK